MAAETHGRSLMLPTRRFTVRHPSTKEELGVIYATTLQEAADQLRQPHHLFTEHPAVEVVDPTPPEPEMKKPTLSKKEELAAVTLVVCTWLMRGLNYIVDISVIATYVAMTWMLGPRWWMVVPLLLIVTKVAIGLVGRRASRIFHRRMQQEIETLMQQLQRTDSDDDAQPTTTH